MNLKIKNLNIGFYHVFPQANDIYKVIDLCRYINENIIKDSELATLIKVTTKRQVDYYKNAARYIGLLNWFFLLMDRHKCK